MQARKAAQGMHHGGGARWYEARNDRRRHKILDVGGGGGGGRRAQVRRWRRRRRRGRARGVLCIARNASVGIHVRACLFDVIDQGLHVGDTLGRWLRSELTRVGGNRSRQAAMR